MSKIICERVELRNFLSYGNTWTDVELLSGINAIIGHDEDKDRSNGAGKTSVLGSIPFALFGKTTKDLSLEKIINWKNGKQCEVRFHFTKDDIKYMIHRGIKPGILALTKDGVNQPLLSDKRAFQQEIEQELIGMDLKSAQMINFQNANNLVSMFTAKKEEKRKFIEKFFNLEVYTKMNELVNKKLGVINDKLSDVVKDIDTKKNRVIEIQQDLGSQVICNIDEEEKRLIHIELEMNKIVICGLEEAKQKLESLNLLTTELLTKKDDAKTKHTGVQSVINNINTTRPLIVKRIEQIGDIAEQRSMVDKINEVLSKLTTLDDEIHNATKEQSNLQFEINDVGYLIKDVKSDITKLEKELNKWNTINAIDAVECPTCFQKVDPEHITIHIEERKGIIQSDIEDEQLKVTQLTDKLNVLNEKMGILTPILDGLKEKKEKKSKLQIKLATYSDLEKKEVELVELQTTLDKIVSEIEVQRELERRYSLELSVIETEFTDATIEYNRVLREVKEIETNIVAYNNLQTELNTLVVFIEKQREVIRKLDLDRDVKIASIAQLNKEVTTLEDSIVKSTTLKDYLSYVKETLKDENTKQYAISNIVPYINSQTNHYLAETGHNYYVKLDNWLEGEILGYGVGSCDFENMSGGEGKSIDLAMKFAMMDVARRQAGSYLDILVLDEILDSSIDSQGLDSLMNIIKVKQQEDDLKVYIVSHREEMAEFGVDRTYQVTKKNGFSNIALV